MNPTEAGWRLTDESGAVMASLAIDGRPSRSTPPTSSSLKHSGDRRCTFERPSRQAAALPELLEPATAAKLHGRLDPGRRPRRIDPQRWSSPSQATGPGPTAATAAAAVGRSRAGASCSRRPGRHTLIGCDNVPVPDWVSSARLAGFDGDELVLLDVSGAELGRLRPADWPPLEQRSVPRGRTVRRRACGRGLEERAQPCALDELLR